MLPLQLNATSSHHEVEVGGEVIFAPNPTATKQRPLQNVAETFPKK